MTITINGTTGIAGVDGSASTPAVQGTDTNTGIFFPAADTIAFGEGGAEVARFDSSGNLGIGSSPAAWGASGVVFKAVQLGTASSLSGFSGGNDLWLSQNAYYDGSAWKYVTTNPAANYGISDNNHIWRTAASGTAGNTITFTERARIDSSGNLLVGRTSVAGSAIFNIRQESAGNLSSTTVTRANATGIYVDDGTAVASNFGNGIWFDSGSLMAGIASTRENTSNWGTDLRFYTHPTTVSAVDDTYERMRIDPAGGLILAGSTAQKATGTTWSNPSDRRIKNNIRDYNKGLAELMQVRVREWEYNGKGGTVEGTKGLGVVADEVMAVLPDTVDNYEAKLNADDVEITVIKKFDATEITWLLVKTAQDLKAINDAQASRIETLEAQNAAFEARLAALEAK